MNWQNLKNVFSRILQRGSSICIASTATAVVTSTAVLYTEPSQSLYKKWLHDDTFSDSSSSSSTSSNSFVNLSFHPQPSKKFESLSDMIEDVFPSLCRIQGAVGDRELGGGSAFVVSEDGIVVTNAHVFAAIAQMGAREIRATFDDGRSFRVEPRAVDNESDIAVGRLIAPSGTRFKPLNIGKSGALRRGDTVVVLGAPLGGNIVPAVGALGGARFVSDDEAMSQVLNSRADWNLLQVDANMSSGSSGGPIVNSNGEVVAVSVMVQLAGATGVGNLSYGVSSDQAWPIVESLIRDGKVTRSSIGMTIILVDSLQAERERNETGVALLPPSTDPMSRQYTGLLVTQTMPGLPADLAGLREGDVVLEINGRRMTRKGDYFAALGPVYIPNQKLDCKIWRPSGRNGGGKIIEKIIEPMKREDGLTKRRHLMFR
jgi:S1-C subfamily serine protease